LAMFFTTITPAPAASPIQGWKSTIRAAAIESSALWSPIGAANGAW
jgi:hypothetical protein